MLLCGLLVLLLAIRANSSPSLVDKIQALSIQQILTDFNTIAYNNRGSRSVIFGYNQSAEYVINQLLSHTDFSITRDYFTLPYSEETQPPILERLGDTTQEYVYGTDYLGMSYSGAGSVVSGLVIPNLDPLGCSANSYNQNLTGKIALVMRGTCSFYDKAFLAQSLGAVGTLIYNDAARQTVFSGTVAPPDGDPLLTTPVVGTSYSVGATLISLLQDPQLVTLINLQVFTLSYMTTTYNVIADSTSGDPKETVVIGSHLDGVDAGPGINDNGSGSATNLHLALLFAELKVKPINRVRFAWWGAEEEGLIGSEKYLQKCAQSGEINNIALNLNFDMIGSLNYVRGIYNGTTDPYTPGSAQITSLFVNYFNSVNLTQIQEPIGAGSDHWSFMDYDIPIGGTSTGAGGLKTTYERELFGGEANAPYDSCYHQPCDNIYNIDWTVIDQMARSAGYAFERLYNMPNLHDFLWPKGSAPTSRSRRSRPLPASSSSQVFYKAGSKGRVESDQWSRPLKF